VSNRLEFLYDGLPVSNVGELIESLRDWFETSSEQDDDDDERYEEEEARRATELADRVAAVGAREAFKELTRPWLGRQGFSLYRTVDDPIPADVYLMPEGDEGDHLAGHIE
jgi:hypothetical protein